jgi:peptidoglycan/xylan/chitin deacetylase (PgdA/CDA1 family)
MGSLVPYGLLDRIKDGVAWRIKPVIRHLNKYRRVFVVQNYHRIFQNNLHAYFDENLFCGMSQDYFYEQLRWFTKNYDILSEQDLLDCMKYNSFPRKSVMITFDDGYKDNHTLAYPVLRDLNVSAIFFIPTQQLLERRLGWWDVLSYYLKNTLHDHVSIDGAKHYIGDDVSRNRVKKLVLEIFYQRPLAETSGLLNEMSMELQVAPPGCDIQSNELMNLEDLIDLINNGMYIGAHTHSHNVLTTLDDASQAREIFLSKKHLESILDIEVRSFAYPVGSIYSFNERTKQMVQDQGFLLAFSFYSGVNIPSQIDPFDIKRTFRGLPYEGFLESYREPYNFIRPRV